MGHRVLVVDLDPQANATSALLPDLDTAAALTTNDVLDAGLEGGALDAVQQTCCADWTRRPTAQVGECSG